MTTQPPPANAQEPAILVHDSRNTQCTLTEKEYVGLEASGMLWEFYPDAPERWPHPTPPAPLAGTANAGEWMVNAAREINSQLNRTHYVNIAAIIAKHAANAPAPSAAGPDREKYRSQREKVIDAYTTNCVSEKQWISETQVDAILALLPPAPLADCVTIAPDRDVAGVCRRLHRHILNLTSNIQDDAPRQDLTDAISLLIALTGERDALKKDKDYCLEMWDRTISEHQKTGFMLSDMRALLVAAERKLATQGNSKA